MDVAEITVRFVVEIACAGCAPMIARPGSSALVVSRPGLNFNISESPRGLIYARERYAEADSDPVDHAHGIRRGSLRRRAQLHQPAMAL